MSVLSVQTKKIPELQSTTSLGNNDMLVVELADGGTKKMTYGSLIAMIRASLNGDENAMLTIANISSVQTDAEGKVPASALLKEVSDAFEIMKREVMAPYGYFGIEQNIDTLMGWVRAGQWDKFAIGDYFIDTRSNGQKVMWEIADKNGYLHCGDLGNGLTTNNIICIPRDCLEEAQMYNATDTNTGGFAASLMPAALEKIAGTFSAKLQGYMATIRRMENNNGSYAWATRRISLPSVTEVFGHRGCSDHLAGSPVCHSLALFTGGNVHLMKGRGFNNPTASRQWYWLADPSAVKTTNFCYVASNGPSMDCAATYPGGLAPLIVLT